jgi:hypothetical protein
MVGFGIAMAILRGGENQVSDAEWKEFSSVGGRFKVLMPGDPRSQSIPLCEEVWSVDRRSEDVHYLVGYAVIPLGNNLPLAERFRGAREGMLRQTPGSRLVRERPISLEGFPGREYEVKIDGKTGCLLARLYVVNRRLYMLMVGGSPVTPTSADALKFLDSFKLIGFEVAANPAPVDLPPIAPPVEPLAKEAPAREAPAREAPVKEAPARRPPVKRTIKPPPAKAPPGEDDLPRPYTGKQPVSPTTLAGLLAYFPFEEGRGGGVKDASGQGNHGSLFRGGWVPGVRGSAIQLKDDQSHFNYGSSPRLNFKARAPFTLALWVSTRNTSGTILSQRRHGDAGPVIELTLDRGRVAALVREDKREPGKEARILPLGRAINDGQWHHLALTRRDSTIELFVDGGSVDVVSGMDSGGPITTDLRALGFDRYRQIHGGAVTPAFRGCFDEFCVFSRALSRPEIGKLAGQ